METTDRVPVSPQDLAVVGRFLVDMAAQCEQGARQLANQAAQIRELRAAAECAHGALDDWMRTHAATEFDPADVRAARERIAAHGGTLAYIAGAILQIRKALK